MGVNGQPDQASFNGAKLDWTSRVLSAEDVRARLNGQLELILRSDTVITPSAHDELRSRRIRVIRQDALPQQTATRGWGYAQDRPYAIVQSVAGALKREGSLLSEIDLKHDRVLCRWAQAVAESIHDGSFCGILAFCEDTSLVCCVANKVVGLRAVAVHPGLRARACLGGVGANFVAIDVARQTFFELKQLVQAICRQNEPVCSGELASVIGELEGHASR